MPKKPLNKGFLTFLWYNISGLREKTYMTMTKRSNYKDLGFIFGSIDELVPEDHLVRKLESAIDWNFIYPLVSDLYSDVGRKSIDPVILFKMIFIDKLFGINSMRKTVEEIKVNLAYRWFLNLSFDDEVPNYSTWSQNYIRRYHDSDVFDKIFERIIKEAVDNKFIDTSCVFMDSTHQKANANKRKSHNEEVEIVKKIYEDDLLKEINEVRRAHGKKEIKDIVKEEIIFDEATGEEIMITKTKNIKVSDTDPECGNFHKGEKEECFAYSHQTACDKNGFILAYDTLPANIHDSASFYNVYHKINDDYKITNIALDAGFKTPSILKAIFDNDQIPLLPYTRQKGRKGYFKKYEYNYDEKSDTYTCPNGHTLNYSTTDKKGYSLYKADKKDCLDCPFKDKCTHSKNKVLLRHVWEGYKEKCEKIRHPDLWKELYPLRKQTIERDFAIAKENHCLRFTRLKGLNKNRHNTAIIYSSLNIKKIALWKYKNHHNTYNYSL